jgi:4-hydroxythreonine-4-phosphate dehydrogenase
MQPGGHRPAPLAVSLGDPAGVGPELIAQAWMQRRAHALPPFFVVCGASVLEAAARARGLDLRVQPIGSPDEAHACFDDALPVLFAEDGDYRPGAPDRDGATLAMASLSHATQLAVSRMAGGVVTGPVAKGRLAEVGFTWPGQTEYVAQASGTSPNEAVMLLAGPNVRTVPLTVHCALADVPAQITEELVFSRGRVLARGLRRNFDIETPRIAVTGLNPHAGEDGRFGHEEAEAIIPAIARLREAGIDVSGPHAADALFAPHKRDTFDAALCMYHDQALIPVKTLDFDSGVNMTLGLPIVRTSPDHGTAFDIAGKGVASAGAMIAAIRMAGDAAKCRKARSARKAA